MRTYVQRNPRREVLRMLDRTVIGSMLLLAMLLVGVQMARASQVVTVVAGAPSTTAYHFSSHPMISGTVVTVNDHQMVVDTDQGEQVTLEVDWRTMAPRDLGPGMVMRAEFLALEDCRFYAQRIIPIRGGMSTNRQQAYANTNDSREAMAHNASAPGVYASQANVKNRASLYQARGAHSPVMTAIPATADYQFSTRAMISGRVVSVNDHRLVVVTDQGQPVGLIMDSHTMVPREITPGSVLRAEFMQLKDGRYYAKRISQVSSSVADREQAYAQTRDSDLLIAQNVPECGCCSDAVAQNTVTAAVERREAVVTPVVESPETLPQTASNQPLILLFGLFSLGCAGLVAVVRRVRII
jgi:hypothetical protein